MQVILSSCSWHKDKGALYLAERVRHTKHNGKSHCKEDISQVLLCNKPPLIYDKKKSKQHGQCLLDLKGKVLVKFGSPLLK